MTDVTTHPAFKNSAATMAMIYDRKRAPENQDLMVSEEDGEIFSTYYLRPRSKEDLERRFETHRKIASWTYGLVGRSPDNFPSYLSGLATRPELFNELHAGFGDNLTHIYKRCRRDDLFLSHTVTNPQVTRRGEFDGSDRVSPTLKVISEDDDGVVLTDSDNF
ncbi:MAG: 4-hydroxyphenylacetate 3-hydroxylase N-terminal domain-containing protein [Rhodospirillales bacterium]